MVKKLCDLKKESLSTLLDGVLDSNQSVSRDAGMRLSQKANEFGLNVRDYLDLAVDFSAEDETARLRSEGLSGYEMAKVKLKLPTRNDFASQVTLAQASNTFMTYPGARNMFKYVVDDMVRWKTRQDKLQSIEGLIAGSRVVDGNEMIRQIVDLNGADADKSFTIGEGADIPVRDVLTSQTSVKFGKIGSGIRMSYEFMQDASLDVLTPFVARIARERELQKIDRCTRILINGDGSSFNPSATVVKQVTLDGTKNSGKLDFDTLVTHITNEAERGVIVDTISGNFSAYAQWVKMFTPNANVTNNPENLAERGLAPKFGTIAMFGDVRFVLNKSVPTGKLLCFNQGETIEELVRSGSQLQEEQQNILNQTWVYTNTERVGYSMIYGDTRSIYDYGSTS